MRKAVVQSTDKLMVDVETAAEMLSVTRSLLYVLIARKRICSIKIGKSRRIAISELHRFVQAEMAAQNGELPPSE